MASFIATRPCGNHLVHHKHNSTPHQSLNPFVTLACPNKKRGQQLIVGSMTLKSSEASSSLPYPLLGTKDLITFCDHNQETVFQERLDKWMEQSAEDIVKNIKQAPLLVQVYDGDVKGGNPKLKTEKAIFENWDVLKTEWDTEKIKTPDGLIFVEEIEDDDNGGFEDRGEEGMTKSWGIVVQGSGMECGKNACYLLKTSRVGAGLGLGMFCTHFCLMRVQSFNQSALNQFKYSWLSR